MLEMTAEEQKARIRARHEGSEDAVRLMKVKILLLADSDIKEASMLSIS